MIPPWLENALHCIICCSVKHQYRIPPERKAASWLIIFLLFFNYIAVTVSLISYPFYVWCLVKHLIFQNWKVITNCLIRGAMSHLIDFCKKMYIPGITLYLRNIRWVFVTCLLTFLSAIYMYHHTLSFSVAKT